MLKLHEMASWRGEKSIQKCIIWMDEGKLNTIPNYWAKTCSERGFDGPNSANYPFIRAE